MQWNLNHPSFVSIFIYQTHQYFHVQTHLYNSLTAHALVLLALKQWLNLPVHLQGSRDELLADVEELKSKITGK